MRAPGRGASGYYLQRGAAAAPTAAAKTAGRVRQGDLSRADSLPGRGGSFWNDRRNLSEPLPEGAFGRGGYPAIDVALRPYLLGRGARDGRFLCALRQDQRRARPARRDREALSRHLCQSAAGAKDGDTG